MKKEDFIEQRVTSIMFNLAKSVTIPESDVDFLLQGIRDTIELTYDEGRASYECELKAQGKRAK